MGRPMRQGGSVYVAGGAVMPNVILGVGADMRPRVRRGRFGRVLNREYLRECGRRGAAAVFEKRVRERKGEEDGKAG